MKPTKTNLKRMAYTLTLPLPAQSRAIRSPTALTRSLMKKMWIGIRKKEMITYLTTRENLKHSKERMKKKNLLLTEKPLLTEAAPSIKAKEMRMMNTTLMMKMKTTMPITRTRKVKERETLYTEGRAR